MTYAGTPDLTSAISDRKIPLASLRSSLLRGDSNTSLVDKHKRDRAGS